MQKRGIFVILFLTGIVCLRSQELSHQVLVPLASTWHGELYHISQSVGEPMVQYLPGEQWELTQGFQQPSMVYELTIKPQGNGIKVYPNPVSDHLKLEMFGDEQVEYHITIFTIDGTIYLRKSYQCDSHYWRNEVIDFRNFKRGLYFVRVESSPERISRIFKIEKM